MNKKTFQAIVNQLNSAKDAHGQSLQMNDLLIMKGDEVFHHNFRDERLPSDVRSISKTVMTLVLGVVMKQAEAGHYPLIDENTYIYPLIKHIIDVKNEANLPKLQNIQIKHLLTHSIGYEDILLMRGDIHDKNPYEFVNDLMNHPIVHDPGKYYLYSNAGFYLLSVVLQQFLKEDLAEFIQRELFNPLGITQFTWERYGEYIAGATRLWLKPEDLLKIGKLFLNNGKASGRSIVSETWLQSMQTKTHATPDVDTPGRTFRRHAYGYGLWLPKDNFYFGHGTDGQILAILPAKETIIITLAEQSDLQPIERIVDEIITYHLN